MSNARVARWSSYMKVRNGPLASALCVSLVEHLSKKVLVEFCRELGEERAG